MELLDVINKDGKVIGTKERKQIYADGDLHKTVHVWVINSDKEILMQKRSAKKDTYPNLWSISVAGHVRAGEDSIKAALRELKEELGIKKSAKELEYLFSIARTEDIDDMHINTIDDVYLIEEDVDVENTKLQFSELTDIKFVYYEYLEQIFKNKDDKYVPRADEHDMLFKYLHDRFDDHDSIGMLYKTEMEYTYSEAMKVNKLYYRCSIIYKAIVTITLMYVFCITVLYFMTTNQIVLNMAIVLFIIFLVLVVWFPSCKAKEVFESNQLYKDAKIYLTFYETYFNIKTKQINIRILYGQLYKVCETDESYYLFISVKDYFIVKKNNIDSSFNGFIKNKVSCPYKKYGKR